MSIFKFCFYLQMSMDNFSLSHLRYSSLGNRIKNFAAIEKIIPLSFDTLVDLPQIKNDADSIIDLDVTCNLNEAKIQSFFSKSFCGNFLVCKQYKCFDTHAGPSIFGDDMKPDIVVSIDTTSNKLLGEYQAVFIIDLKASDVNPCAPEFIGQASSYCIRLLELSSHIRRNKAICCVTNLEVACIIQVVRTSENTYSYLQSMTSASQALTALFNSKTTSFGLSGINNIVYNSKNYLPLFMLGIGGSAIVYSTNFENQVIKFYHGSNIIAKKTMQKEKKMLELLSFNKPKEIDLQHVIGEIMSPINWPILIISPLGINISPFSCGLKKPLSAFQNIWETIKYIHNNNVIHNDIRPENIIEINADRWMLIDFAAAIQKPENEKTCFIEYSGGVTCTSDSVLSDLENYIEGESYKAHVSFLTDTISFIRAMNLFLSRITKQSYNELLEFRSKLQFRQIRDWWDKHTTNHTKEFINKLEESFAIDERSIYSLVDNYLAQNLMEYF